MTIKSPKKLIEVALPLDDINVASAREKSIRHGHPSTLHLWWARRPLAAARAVLFAQMVNDPGGERGYFAGKTKAQADAEREKLFQIIRDLVKWENTNNEEVLERARAEIRKSWRETCELNKGKPGFDPDKLPAFHDPFAGGGAIPLEAQRLGLESYASDLNPVAVLINKAMIEIPPKFAGRKPVGPMLPGDKQGKMHEDWSGARGLAEDVRRYGHWMREQAEQRIGHLYPKVQVTAAMAVERPDLKPYVGESLTVIAWLWARTVKSPNPAFAHVDVPLASSFVLSNKKGKEVWVEPIVDVSGYIFKVRVGYPPDGANDGTKISQGAFRCLLSGAPIQYAYIDQEANAGRMGARLKAICLEGRRGRIYVDPTEEQALIAASAMPSWSPDTPCRGTFASNAQGRTYGFKVFGDYFTARQLTALTTLSDLVAVARRKVITDASKAGQHDDRIPLRDGGEGATAYADAIATYLAFLVDQETNQSSTICGWNNINQQMIVTFSRQAISMVWDYAECNIFSSSTGSFANLLDRQCKGLSTLGITDKPGFAQQADAADQEISVDKVISIDPPYYDNIGYADLSDYFYVWLRKSLNEVFPKELETLATPKAAELIAAPYRQGGKAAAEVFFLNGLSRAIRNLVSTTRHDYPLTIFYAFKQQEVSDSGDISNTGWETFLRALIDCGLSIVGTWPIKTESANKLKANVSALASSIVLVCRKRASTADIISRRDFQRQLREQMPGALETMIGGTTGQSPIAPVDLAQAAIGPGMAIYSKYAGVLNQDGTSMSVHDALILINREITDYLTPDAGSFDNDTLFCNSWFEQFGWSKGDFGQADVLARGKGTSVGGVTDAGVVESGSGKVRLLRWAEYPGDWDPQSDTRTPIWEAAHHLIRALNQQGESEAGALLARMPEKGEAIRQLAYHLYTLCERKKWADDARAYNELITAWHAIVSASHETGHRGSQLGMEI